MKTKYLVGLLVLCAITLIAIAMTYAKEGFQSTGPQMLCAIEYAKANPATVTDKALQKYIVAFDLADAKKKQSLATNANFVLRKVQTDGMSGRLNAYYGRVRGNKAILSCMKRTYAI
jgi:hypothetical protein